MTLRSHHVTVRIDRPAREVYDFCADPANLPRWAAGLAGSSIRRDGADWVTDAGMGQVRIRFVPANDHGVLDHDVTLDSGETFYNPMRVIAWDDACEVVFTARQQPGMPDADFERDVAAVAQDLATLKGLLERT